jgi:hypothetical protein
VKLANPQTVGGYVLTKPIDEPCAPFLIASFPDGAD